MEDYENMDEEEESSLKLKRYIIGCIIWTFVVLMKSFSVVLSQVSHFCLSVYKKN